MMGFYAGLCISVCAGLCISALPDATTFFSLSRFIIEHLLVQAKNKIKISRFIGMVSSPFLCFLESRENLTLDRHHGIYLYITFRRRLFAGHPNMGLHI